MSIRHVFEEKLRLQIDFSSLVVFWEVGRNFFPHVYTFM